MNVKNKIQQLKDDKLAYLIVVLRKKNGGKFGRRIPLIYSFLGVYRDHFEKPWLR